MHLRLLTGPLITSLQFERKRDPIHYEETIRTWQDFSDEYR